MTREEIAAKTATIPRWAMERMERERAHFLDAQPNFANLDVMLAEPRGWHHYLMFAAHIAEHNKPALVAIAEQLAKPVKIEAEERQWTRAAGEVFDPWEIFPSIYGSYSSEFDDMAILVLENLLNVKWGADAGEGLAHQMFREMLCVENLCDYGTSPRGCFPTPEFRDVLPALLEKWRAYRAAEWEED
jgi:hypothetical protein